MEKLWIQRWCGRNKVLIDPRILSGLDVDSVLMLYLNQNDFISDMILGS
ncbi:MAG: hypothetical protein WKF36_05450 [Candidatus Nitrosocosmicus sp.]